MPIPRLNLGGVLLGGLHHCTLLEIKARFGTFHQSDRRFGFDVVVAEQDSSLYRP